MRIWLKLQTKIKRVSGQMFRFNSQVYEQNESLAPPPLMYPPPVSSCSGSPPPGEYLFWIAQLQVIENWDLLSPSSKG